jgi:hypothetical protein
MQLSAAAKRARRATTKKVFRSVDPRTADGLTRAAEHAEDPCLPPKTGTFNDICHQSYKRTHHLQGPHGQQRLTFKIELGPSILQDKLWHLWIRDTGDYDNSRRTDQRAVKPVLATPASRRRYPELYAMQTSNTITQRNTMANPRYDM